MPVIAGKLQGIKSQFSYTATGGGTAVQFKSLSGWDVDVTAKEIDVSDHDSAGWGDKLTGLADWKATIKGFHFEGDASQLGLFDALSAALTGVGDLACQFFPVKNTGNLVLAGTGVVTGYKRSDGGTSGAQTVDVTISGRGALTHSVQA